MFEAQDLSIGGIFEEGLIYSIPNYQRGYAWESEQVSRMVKDILEATKKGKDMYFLSSIITCDTGDRNKGEEVIDGQQRLITLSLIMKRLADRISKDSLDRSKLIQCIKTERNGTEDTIMNVTNKSDRECLERYLLGKQNREPKDHPIVIANNLVRKIISKLSEKEIGDLSKFILEKLHIVKITQLTE